MNQHLELLIKAEKKQSFAKGLLFGFTIASVFVIAILFFIFDKL